MPTKKFDIKKIKWTKKTGGSIVAFTKKGDHVEGVYAGFRKNKGQFGIQKIHKLQNAAGEDFELWGSTVIDGALEDVKKGTPVTIVYTGLAGKGKNKYKNFDIFIPEE